MFFEIIGEIGEIETIAIGGNIRDIMRIQKQYGPGRWRKRKGIAKIRLEAAGYAVRSYTGMKLMALAERK